MKFQIETKNFLDGVSRVKSVMMSANRGIILDGVILKTDKSLGLISISGIGVDAMFKGTYESKIESDGSCIVDVKKLYDILRVSSGTTVDCSLEQQKLFLKSGISKFYLNSENVPEFESEFDKINNYKDVNIGDLSDLLNSVYYCTGSSDTTNYALQGMFLAFDSEEGDLISSVSTDSHRIATTKKKIPYFVDNSIQSIILSPKAITELRNILSAFDRDDTIQLAMKKTSHLVVKKDNLVYFLGLLSNVSYPSDIRRVIRIPEKKNCFTCLKSDLANALKRCMVIFSSSESQAVTMELEKTMGKSILIIKSHDRNVGNVIEQVEGEFYGDSKIKTAISAKYVSQVIENYPFTKEEQVNIQFGEDSITPILFHTDNDLYFRNMIMPFRLETVESELNNEIENDDNENSEEESEYDYDYAENVGD